MKIEFIQQQNTLYVRNLARIFFPNRQKQLDKISYKTLLFTE